jgi:SPP1 family phage portal protein
MENMYRKNDGNLTSDLINPISNSAIIQDMINSDIISRKKKEMLAGVKYYIGDHDILDRIPTYVDKYGKRVPDPAKTNIKLPHPFHRNMVKDKVGYILANPVSFSSDDDKLAAFIVKALGHKLDDVMNEWVKGASNKGVEWLHPYISGQGKFCYLVIPAEQCIPVWENSYQDTLLYMIRYYVIQHVNSVSNETKNIYKVEFWDSEKVTYYIQDDDTYVYDVTEPINPRYHWYSWNTLTPEVQVGNSWGRVPFIPLENNDEETTDLAPIKALIDDYDLNASDFSNNLADIQEFIWLLEGYDGTNLDEFMENIKRYKAVNVGVGGSVKRESGEIPKDARDSHLQRSKENIFAFGMGLDPTTDKLGSDPSGVALKWQYQGVIKKSDELIRKLKTSLHEFASYIVQYINLMEGTKYDVANVKPVISAGLMANDKEVIETLQNSATMLSKKTILEKHPYVSSVSEELKRIEDEQKAASPNVVV